VLDKIYKLLNDEPQPKEALCERIHMDPESFDKALEKLWIPRRRGARFRRKRDARPGRMARFLLDPVGSAARADRPG